MKKFINFMEKYFVPVAGRIGAQRHLVAIRDGFVILMPLIIAGSLGTLINAFPVKGYQNFMINVFGESWKSFGSNIWNGSIAIMSFLAVFTIAYNLAKCYESDGLTAGVVAFAALLSITKATEDGSGIPYSAAGGVGLFLAIIVALISTEIFVRLRRNKSLIIKMPDNVPPAVSKSFASLLPVIITISIFSIIRILFAVIGVDDIHKLIYDALQAPLVAVANTLWSAILIALLNHLFWFFGLHGSNILEPVMQAVYLPALEKNMAAAAAGDVIPNIVTKPFFDAFVYMGGSGATICLIIAIYIASKRKHHRNMANLSLGPGLFNINESMIYGMPIVLNPAFIIPFILTPVLLTIISYAATAIGLVPRTIAMVPWTTPPILSGWIATGGSAAGSILQIINLVIGVIIYIPFIVLAEKIEDKKSKNIVKEIDNSIKS
ncbi:MULTISPECIES: PTS sugar transporter subunit IIC [unclassified Clostridium]|uniref:PTS sugar transporter subunit IIC n=1 Tax=unclassified Clostridium TaxID=2614128 RepID=UPI0025C6B6FB|nr:MULTISPECIES: PTS sugar transporter subunit IIC [unclassified Clostridium]